MDRSRKNLMQTNSQEVANVINEFIKSSGMITLAAIFCCVIVIAGITFYSNVSLQKNSGYYRVNLHKDTQFIKSSHIIDHQHYFDDRLAMVLNGTSLMLHDILQISTSSLPALDAKLLKYTEGVEGTAIADIYINFEEENVLKALTGEKIALFNFEINGAPLLIEPQLAGGTKFADVRPLSALNDMEVDLWEIEINGKIAITNVLNSSRKRENKLRFTVNVLSIDKSYNSDSIRLVNMSRWKLR